MTRPAQTKTGELAHTPGREAARTETIEALDLLSDLHTDTFAAIVRLVAGCVEAPICLFSVVHGDRQYFRARVGTEDTDTPRSVSVCARAIEQDEELFVVDDLSNDPTFSSIDVRMNGKSVRFYAGAVVAAPNGLPVGTICLLDHEPRRLSDAERERLLDARQLMEAALELQADSNRDHLTGLYNRRYFDELLDREWRRAIRYMVPFTLLMIDIDHFGAYNDRYGHPDGDEALRQVARTIRASIRRPSDLCARFGGEEFIVMLPETDPDAARTMADRIRAAVEQLAIDHADSQAGHLTVSIGAGVALDQDHLESGPAGLIEIADEALYEAKDAGRNTTRLKTTH